MRHALVAAVLAVTLSTCTPACTARFPHGTGGHLDRQVVEPNTTTEYPPAVRYTGKSSDCTPPIDTC